MTVDFQGLLARREQVANDIVKIIDLLGALVRQQVEVEDQLRRAAERDGSRTNPFSTAATVADAINSELTRVGISLRRADPRFRLTELVASQHDRYRRQWAARAQVAGKSAA